MQRTATLASRKSILASARNKSDIRATTIFGSCAAAFDPSQVLSSGSACSGSNCPNNPRTFEEKSFDKPSKSFSTVSLGNLNSAFCSVSTATTATVRPGIRFATARPIDPPIECPTIISRLRSNAFDLKRVIIVGHSMGGSIGLAVAKRMPGRTVAVVAVDTLQNAEFKFPKETVEKLLDGLSNDFSSNVRGLFGQLLPEQADPELRTWLGSKAAAQDPKMAVALMSDLFRADAKMLLREANVPVRCINSAGGYPFYNPTMVEKNRTGTLAS